MAKQTIRLKTITIEQCEIVVGSRLSASVNDYLQRQKPAQVLFVTDSSLVRLLKSYLAPHLDAVLVIPAGERHKNSNTVSKIVRFLIEKQADRSTILVGFGGGMVTDLVGYLASIYMRGIACAFIPTTLLGMIDAAIGGKNALNVGQYKNLLGTIRQPSAVFVDTDFLKSLPEADYRSGLGELMRYGLGMDEILFRQLEKDPQLKQLEFHIKRAIAIKVSIVQRDPREEHGGRRLLNLGHSFGHALEAASGFKLKHGLAVAIGLNFAAFASQKLGILSESDRHRIEELLLRHKLPVYKQFDIPEVIGKMQHDKKKQGKDTLNFIALKGIGQAVVYPLTLDQLKGLLKGFQASKN